jgi:hypothetical protein
MVIVSSAIGMWFKGSNHQAIATRRLSAVAKHRCRQNGRAPTLQTLTKDRKNGPTAESESAAININRTQAHDYLLLRFSHGKQL